MTRSKIASGGAHDDELGLALGPSFSNRPVAVTDQQATGSLTTLRSDRSSSIYPIGRIVTSIAPSVRQRMHGYPPNRPCRRTRESARRDRLRSRVSKRPELLAYHKRQHRSVRAVLATYQDKFVRNFAPVVKSKGQQNLEPAEQHVHTRLGLQQ